MIVCIFTVPSSKDLGDKLHVDIWEQFREFDIAGSVYLVKNNS